MKARIGKKFQNLKFDFWLDMRHKWRMFWRWIWQEPPPTLRMITEILKFLKTTVDLIDHIV